MGNFSINIDVKEIVYSHSLPFLCASINIHLFIIYWYLFKPKHTQLHSHHQHTERPLHTHPLPNDIDTVFFKFIPLS
jgi:hypothetical protein